MTQRPNYCHLLGLNPLKESTYKLEDIKKKIETKGTKWKNDSNNKQNDNEQRFKSQGFVNLLPDMERVMSDPVLRSKEFKDGVNLLKGMAERLKSECVILSDGTFLISPNTAEQQVKKIRWDGVTKNDVLSLVNIKDRSPPKPVSDTVINGYKALRSVDTYTPVDLLNALIDRQNLEIALDRLTEGSSPAQIRKAFEVCDKRINNVRPDVLPEQDAYIQALRSLKLCLEDEPLKKLSEYGRCNHALLPVIEEIERDSTRQLTRRYIDELLSVHLTKDINVDMAISILQDHCFKKKIPANFSNVESSMQRCMNCKSMIHVTPDTMFCPICGHTFKIQCPHCSTVQSSSNTNCIKCGCNFADNENKTRMAVMDFNSSMSKGKIASARKSYNKVKDLSPNHRNLESMLRDLTIAETDLESRKKVIMSAAEKKRSYEVKTLIDSMMEKYPDAVSNDIELSQKYSESVSNLAVADNFCNRAKAEATKAARTKLYVQAVNACPDHPVAVSKLKEDPPMCPSTAGNPYAEDNAMVVKFVPLTDAANTTYCIYRQRGSFPTVTDDTKPLREIPATDKEYVDGTMDFGVEYYYVIHSKRYGILSREFVKIGPVSICAKVEDITIKEIDGGLRIIYTKPRGAWRVRIWRTEAKNPAAHEVELGLNGQEVYDDRVEGGKEYKYKFIAEYKIDNRTKRSDTTTRCQVTTIPPEPVNNISIRRNEGDGSFTAKWVKGKNVTLYATPTKIPAESYRLNMEDVETWMKPVKLIEKGDGEVKFRLDDGEIVFIYPIIPVGQIGYRGKCQLVSNARPFRDVKTSVNNNECVITMTWPDKAVMAKIVVSNDSARTPEDSDAEIHTIRREDYIDKGQVRIRLGRAPKKCINIFAIYKVDDTEIKSQGVPVEIYTAEARKVRYTVKSERTGMRLDIQADPDVKEIPPVVATQVAEGIPLKRNDGAIIWRSHGPVQLIGGKVSLSVQCKNLEDIARMRLFFADDRDYNLFRFIHPLYNRRD